MKNLLLPIFALLLMLTAACHKDPVIKSEGVNLRFSTDTVFLDTVFTTVGSSTYTLKVFNPEDEIVIVDNIRLNDPNSLYRLNINGTASNNLTDVEILPNDSIYIFVEVTNNLTNPGQIVYEDQIIFNNKGTSQDVKLVTLVWDAEFHYPDRFIAFGSTLIPYSNIDCNDVWANGEKHVVYGYARIPDGCELQIDPGAEVYFHNNSGLWVSNGGQLKIAENAQAGLSDSVLFTGDRLEPFYEDSPGQWGGVLGGIFIDDGARAIINNTVIKNAVNAIRLDSAQFSDQLVITNTSILNTSRTGMYGGFGSVEAGNLIIANSGLHNLYCFGGNYRFRHCTFANYWSQSTRTTPAVVLTNFLDVQNSNGGTTRFVRSLNNAYFGNCIVFGSNTQELSLLEDETGGFNYQFNNTLFKLNTIVDQRGFDVTDPRFSLPLVNLDPQFVNTNQNNYALDSGSQAIDQGNITDIGPYILDLKGNIRNTPDLGALERTE
jgi:hypothetical protein